MITILGASGFIGSHLVRHLQSSGLEFQAPARDEPLSGRALGHVIYCIGLTADFRERPYDAVEAHVSKLLDVVRRCTFDSLLYLSSTRVYLHNSGIAREEDDLRLNPLRFDDLYNASKLTGEAIALSLGAKGRVARPSNVYGAGQRDTFLAMVLDEYRSNGTIALRSALHCERDYVSATDVARLLVQIALGGRERIYNIASGIPVTNAELMAAIGCEVTVAPDAPATMCPRIGVERIRTEFGFTPASLLDELPSLLGRNA